MRFQQELGKKIRPKYYACRKVGKMESVSSNPADIIENSQFSSELKEHLEIHLDECVLLISQREELRCDLFNVYFDRLPFCTQELR